MTSKKTPLFRFIQQQTSFSRRRILEFITNKDISVNQQIITNLSMLISEQDDMICIKNKIIKKQHPFLYLMYHKPDNMLTTMSDPKGRLCLGDVSRTISPTLFPVGRLDKNTTGLIILTNDGIFSQKLAHPRFKITKTYLVSSKKPFSSDLITQLEAGLFLEDGPIQFFDCTLLNSTCLQLSLSEGRNRIIRRCFSSLNIPIESLHRVGIGPFKLGALQSNDWQELNMDMVNKIRHHSV